MLLDLEQFIRKIKLSDIQKDWDATVHEAYGPAGFEGTVIYIPGVTCKQLFDKKTRDVMVCE